MKNSWGWTKEQEQDRLLKDLADYIRTEAPHSVYETAVKFQELGDCTEAQYNKFEFLIEEAQSKGLLS